MQGRTLSTHEQIGLWASSVIMFRSELAQMILEFVPSLNPAIPRTPMPIPRLWEVLEGQSVGASKLFGSLPVGQQVFVAVYEPDVMIAVELQSMPLTATTQSYVVIRRASVLVKEHVHSLAIAKFNALSRDEQKRVRVPIWNSLRQDFGEVVLCEMGLDQSPPVRRPHDGSAVDAVNALLDEWQADDESRLPRPSRIVIERYGRNQT